MVMILRVEDYGTPAVVARHMQESGMSTVNMKEVYYRIILDIMRLEEEIWKSGGRRSGGSWAKLAEATVRKKGHDTILIDTDKLINSVTKLDAPYQILQVESDDFTFGTYRPGATTHEYGRGHVPMRPFMRFSDYDQKRWASWMLQHITKSFEKPTM